MVYVKYEYGFGVGWGNLEPTNLKQQKLGIEKLSRFDMFENVHGSQR